MLSHVYCLTYFTSGKVSFGKSQKLSLQEGVCKRNFPISLTGNSIMIKRKGSRMGQNDLKFRLLVDRSFHIFEIYLYIFLLLPIFLCVFSFVFFQLICRNTSFSTEIGSLPHVAKLFFQFVVWPFFFLLYHIFMQNF